MKVSAEVRINNNNNEYLERLARTGPKRLHALYKYILSNFNAYNMNRDFSITLTSVITAPS